MQPLRVALVGTGFTLNTQLPAFRLLPQVTVTDLVGRDAAKTQGLAQQHGIQHASTSLDTVLQRGDIDLACITTPVDLHRNMAEQCLHAGVAVLCEKPMAMDVDEAASMQAVAQQSGQIALIDHQLRYSPNLARMRRLLHDGYLGKPLHVELVLRVAGRLDPRRTHDWWSEAARGGGVLGALGSHMIDQLRWLFGEIHSVCGTERTFVPERPQPGSLELRPVDSDDFASFSLVVGPHRLHASVVLSVVAHATDAMRLEVFGDHGMLRLDENSNLFGSRWDRSVTGGGDAAGQERLNADEPISQADMRQVPDSLFGRAFVLFTRQLVMALQAPQATTPATDPLRDAATFADGLAVQHVLDALRRSHRERRWVDLPG